MSMIGKIEYRVRSVTRYIVTRHEESVDGKTGSTGGAAGEYPNADIAYEVGYALCKAEHDRLKLPPGDERIQYPVHPDRMVSASTLCAPVSFVSVTTS